MLRPLLCCWIVAGAGFLMGGGLWAAEREMRTLVFPFDEKALEALLQGGGPKQLPGELVAAVAVNMRGYFEGVWVPFPPSSSAVYLPQGGVLAVRNTEENLGLVIELIKAGASQGQRVRLRVVLAEFNRGELKKGDLSKYSYEEIRKEAGGSWEEVAETEAMGWVNRVMRTAVCMPVYRGAARVDFGPGLGVAIPVLEEGLHGAAIALVPRLKEDGEVVSEVAFALRVMGWPVELSGRTEVVAKPGEYGLVQAWSTPQKSYALLLRVTVVK